MRWFMPVAAVVALASVAQAAAFANTEPAAAQEWYLTADKAWDFWQTMPQLAPVKVAIVDSGIDYGHPEFVGRIAGGKTFVGGTWKRDTDGHGTFVAGEIAANPTNGLGMAGLAFNARLLIAKVVKPDGTVSLPGEIDAIRWAVRQGARVINLSLGGVRDPIDMQLDTYSALEQQAVQYAYAHGVVVVAAVGNGTESPETPWRYADYPSALPHVIGVSAIGKDGNVPSFSNRDAAYVDIAAPGVDIFSTVPRGLVDTTKPFCTGQPYSDCGPFEFRNAIGTSFAAPQVSAAAALLLGQDPYLRPDDVSWLLERTAVDEKASSGCSVCPVHRDAFTGWGRLDVEAALARLMSGQPLPLPDRYEPNDNAGAWARPIGSPATITASVDFWDDQVDVYSIRLSKGERLYTRLTPHTPAQTRLVLWKPGTKDVNSLRLPLENEAARSLAVGTQERIAFEVPQTGVYDIEIKLTHPTRNPVEYTLGIATQR